MKRNVIAIDENKCVGCGLCASACQEGAIGMVDGKAKLLREDYCDGLGNCLPVCPTGAISFDEQEITEKVARSTRQLPQKPNIYGGCPGSGVKELHRTESSSVHVENTHVPLPAQQSELLQWPIQINLVRANASYFEDAQLLVAADCTAFAYGAFHTEMIKNRIALIGCPKLDKTDYSVKLAEIIQQNNIKNITVVRMEVPCCGGIVQAVEDALRASGKIIPWQIETISIDGNRL